MYVTKQRVTTIVSDILILGRDVALFVGFFIGNLVWLLVGGTTWSKRSCSLYQRTVGRDKGAIWIKYEVGAVLQFQFNLDFYGICFIWF